MEAQDLTEETTNTPAPSAQGDGDMGGHVAEAPAETIGEDHQD